MSIISKNVYVYKLDDVVDKCNNTCRSKIKMKPVDVKSSTYINSSKETKFKIGVDVKISKYKKHFCKRLCSKLA